MVASISRSLKWGGQPRRRNAPCDLKPGSSRKLPGENTGHKTGYFHRGTDEVGFGTLVALISYCNGFFDKITATKFVALNVATREDPLSKPRASTIMIKRLFTTKPPSFERGPSTVDIFCPRQRKSTNPMTHILREGPVRRSMMVSPGHFRSNPSRSLPRDFKSQTSRRSFSPKSC